MDVDRAVSEIQSKYKVVGRTDELRRAVIARLSNSHLLLEGPVGVGKTTLAMALAQYFQQPILRVDGDERYSEAKLVGYFDPPLVLSKGYVEESFMPGPLTSALRQGGILFLNELNRFPEGTQNVLLPALDEGLIEIPRLATVKAKPSFFVVATQNPAEYIGVTGLSEAIRDRFVWIRLDHQPENQEVQIVKQWVPKAPSQACLITVRITRATRSHRDLRRGSSIRGAIDMARMISQYSKHTPQLWKEVAIMALATKVEREDGIDIPLEAIIESIVKEILRGF